MPSILSLYTSFEHVDHCVSSSVPASAAIINPAAGQLSVPESPSPSCGNPRLCPISCATVAALYRNVLVYLTSFTFCAHVVAQTVPNHASPMVPPSKSCPDSTTTSSAPLKKEGSCSTTQLETLSKNFPTSTSSSKMTTTRRTHLHHPRFRRRLYRRTRRKR